jgi:hypothetical protein
MGNTGELNSHEAYLRILSTTRVENKTTIDMCNKDYNIIIAVSTNDNHKGRQNKLANIVLELWNEYHNLPLSHRFSPKVVFQSMILNEKLLTKKNTEVDMQEEHIVLLTEQLRDLRWWNKVYRWSLFVMLLGLLGCAWYFNYTH